MRPLASAAMRRMSADSRFFVDTDVLLYSVDAKEARKQKQARLWLAALWESGAGRLSWQVLHEFYANAVRKTGAAPTPARKTVEAFERWRPVEMNRGLIQRGWHWMDKAGVSYWDSLILAAAEQAGCSWMLSEDFQTGRAYGPVTVVNPFERAPADFGFDATS